MSFLREDLAHGIARIRAVDTHAHLLEPEAYGFPATAPKPSYPACTYGTTCVPPDTRRRRGSGGPSPRPIP